MTPDLRPTTHPTGRKRPSLLRRFRPFIAGLLLLALAFYGYVRYQLSPINANGTATEFEVQPGWGGNRVAAELAQAGLVRNGRVFSLYLRYNDFDRAIGEGLYDLSPAMTVPQLAAALAEGGRARTALVVLPEGLRLAEVARRFASAGLGEEAALLTLMQTPGELRPAYVPENSTLEGYLFPEGYSFPLGSSEAKIVRTMLEHFEAVSNNYADALGERGLSVSDWVTLASMVQAEAANVAEMGIVSGVFWNRLDEGMRLQSDPTAAYGVGKTLPQLVADDLRQDTPWNTYTRAGLPQTPINNPGLEALRAVLEPVRVNEQGEPYLYFLHGVEDGQPVFRPNTTLEAHNQDVQRYLR